MESIVEDIKRRQGIHFESVGHNALVLSAEVWPDHSYRYRGTLCRGPNDHTPSQQFTGGGDNANEQADICELIAWHEENGFVRIDGKRTPGLIIMVRMNGGGQ